MNFMKICAECTHFKVCNAYWNKSTNNPVCISSDPTHGDSADDCRYFEDNSLDIKLPCKINDTIYVKMQFGNCVQATVTSYYYSDVLGFCVKVASDKFANGNEVIPFSEFGKTIFLTCK